jgi:hypothetical protein
MLGNAPGSADTPRAHKTNMAALGTEIAPDFRQGSQLTSIQNVSEI